MGKKYKNTIPQRRNTSDQNILKDAQSHELAEKNKLEVTGKKEIQLLPSAMYEGSFLPEEPSGCAHKNSPRVGSLTLLVFILILCYASYNLEYFTPSYFQVFVQHLPAEALCLGWEPDTYRDNLEYNGVGRKML